MQTLKRSTKKVTETWHGNFSSSYCVLSSNVGGSYY